MKRTALHSANAAGVVRLHALPRPFQDGEECTGYTAGPLTVQDVLSIHEVSTATSPAATP